MIHYSCDVCGVTLPADYKRSRPGTSLGSLCGVSDVCPTCQEVGGRLNVAAILLGAWRQLREEPEPQQDGPTPEEVLREKDVGSRSQAEAEDKRAILGRLQRYRKVHGLGCLDAVAKKGGASVTPELLRDVLNGNVVMGIEAWRRIGKALDKLEEEERKAVGHG